MSGGVSKRREELVAIRWIQLKINRWLSKGSIRTVFESGGFVLLTEFLLPRVYAESPACQSVLGVGISTRIGESSYRHL